MKRIERYIYIVLIIILVGVISAGTTYILMDKKSNNSEIKEKDKQEENKKEEEKITLSEKELEQYLSYIPNGNDYSLYNNNNPIQGAYDMKIANINSINKNLLLARVITLLSNDNKYFANNKEISLNKKIMSSIMGVESIDEELTTKDYYSLTFINSKLKEMYNYELGSLKNAMEVEDTFNINGMCYYYDNGNIIMCGGGDNFQTNINLIEKYEANEKELIIYENAALLLELNEEKILRDYYNKYEVKINNNDAINYIKEHKDKFTKYKHIYKKNDTGYYWYQTDVVE